MFVINENVPTTSLSIPSQQWSSGRRRWTFMMMVMMVMMIMMMMMRMSLGHCPKPCFFVLQHGCDRTRAILPWSLWYLRCVCQVGVGVETSKRLLWALNGDISLNRCNGMTLLNAYKYCEITGLVISKGLYKKKCSWNNLKRHRFSIGFLCIEAFKTCFYFRGRYL